MKATANTVDPVGGAIEGCTADQHPAAEKRFRAVAVNDSSFLKEEAGTTPEERPEDYEIILISFEGLRDAYNAVYELVPQSFDPDEGRREGHSNE